jgi:hypothetical protein
MLSAVWMAAPQVAAHFEGREPIDPSLLMYAWTALCVLMVMAASRWGRESLSKTAVNRSIRAAIFVGFAPQFALEVGGSLLKLPIAYVVVLHFLVWFSMLLAVSVLLDRRLWPSALGYLLSFVLLCVVPSWRWHVMSLAHFVLFANIAVAWGSLDDRPRMFRRRGASGPAEG